METVLPVFNYVFTLVSGQISDLGIIVGLGVDV